MSMHELSNLAVELKDTFAAFKTRHRGEMTDITSRMDELEKAMSRPGMGGGSLAPKTDAKALAEFFSATRRRDVAPDEVAGQDLSEYSASFAKWSRLGENAIGMDVKAAMSVGSDPDGGFFVPPQMLNTIKTKLWDTSPMRSICGQMTITGSDHIAFPVDSNDATTGGWVGETASRAATTSPTIGEQKIFLREQYAMPEVTQKLLDMSSFDVEQWLVNKIVEKLSRDENTGFVSGTGVTQPRGFLDYKSAAVTTDDDSRSWGVLQYVATGASAAFPTVSGVPSASDPDSLITLQSKLKSQYRENAVWLMNRATWATVRKLKDGDGRYLAQDSLVAGTPPQLLGSPVITAEDMPDVAANSYSIAYGDFGRGYMIVDGPSLKILRDPFTNKPYVRFYTTKWTGGDVTDFDAIKLLKFAAA